ncbi:MAG TPA: hypothetical protein VF855_15075, partial [Acidimicrobiales bacterium]
MSGCAKSLIVLAIIFVGLFVLIGVAVVAAGIWLTDKVDEAITEEQCSFLSDSKAQDLFGPSADAQKLSSFGRATFGLVLDNRALADSYTCYVTVDGAAISRLARDEGGAAVYERERKAADPVSEDRGGGITVTREGWYADDVEGLGDEAFCTAVDMLGQVGVLVRQGGTVLYVSVGATQFDPGKIEVGE